MQSSRAQALVRGCYAYDGKFWMVPENFMFPSRANTFQAFTFWFLGMPEYRTQKDYEILLSPVPPFRKFDPSLMPAKIRQTISSMSKKLLGSQIKKFGTDADKVRADARENLTHRNKARRTYRPRTR